MPLKTAAVNSKPRPDVARNRFSIDRIPTVQILGILNLTRDSFSDGGRYLAPDQALAHARQLVADGANIIDIGAESTHPDAEDVPADEEIARLTPVIEALHAEGVPISVDTHKPSVMRAVLGLGADLINDVTALRDAAAVAAVRDSSARIIIMHSIATGARAERTDVPELKIIEPIMNFFLRRVGELERAGISRERLILDPGMGFFLGSDPAVSLTVLRDLDRIATLGLPLCISTSRKSFIGAVLGAPGRPRPVDQRSAGTLATELWAMQSGVEYVRTHDVRALRDALAVWNAIAGPPRPH